MKKAIEFLRYIEWRMGCNGGENKGQCYYCCGLSKYWIYSNSRENPERCGHKKTCNLAYALEDLGEKVDRIK